MAVYREGFTVLKDINLKSVRIYNDSADWGVPVRKGDKIWNDCKQLIDWYGNEGTRHAETYSTGKSVTQEFTLIDEWAVSDERKTVKEATEVYRLSYVTCTTGRCVDFDGYVTINQIR